MLRKNNRDYDSCDASQREPLFLRVSPGGVSAISLTSFLRNGIHLQMAVSPTPLGLFMRETFVKKLQSAARRVSRFICDNFIDTFISDNLQDEYAIDIYQRNPGRGHDASYSTLQEYLLTSAQRGEEIKFSGVRLLARLPLWMKHIKLRCVRAFANISIKNTKQEYHVAEFAEENGRQIGGPGRESHSRPPGVCRWKTLILKGGRWMEPRYAVN